MDLDEFKNIWDKVQETEKEFTDDELLKISDYKSRNLMEEIKKKFIKENLIGLLLFLPLLIIAGIFNSVVSPFIIWFLIILFATAIIYIVFRFVQINKLLQYDLSTLVFLERSVDFVKNYIKLAYYSTYILVPISFFIGFLAGTGFVLNEDNIGKVLQESSIIALLIGCIITTFLSVVLVRRIYNKLYGKQLNELKYQLEKYK